MSTGWQQISDIMYNSTVTLNCDLVTFSAHWRLIRYGPFNKISFLCFLELFRGHNRGPAEKVIFSCFHTFEHFGISFQMSTRTDWFWLKMTEQKWCSLLLPPLKENKWPTFVHVYQNVLFLPGLYRLVILKLKRHILSNGPHMVSHY